jgi:hypothetical protein
MAVGLTAGLPLAGADTQDFTEPGSDVFTVPENVCSVSVEALGGQGGNATGFGTVPPAAGGLGGGQSGTFEVTPVSTTAVAVVATARFTG